MPDLDLWPVLLLLLLGALTIVILFASRTREVPQGYLAVVEKANRFARIAGPGRYLLWPQEEEVARLFVRQREAVASVPNVFTDGSLSVIVNLRYAFYLDPKLMNESEIYYSDEERLEQQRTLLKLVFQELTYELSQTTTPRSEADRVDMFHLFSPFTGAKLRTIQLELGAAVRAAFRPHGIVVTDAPVIINGLTLPVDVTRAYTHMLSTDFNSTAQANFIRRLKHASPELSEPALVQLFNTLQGDAQDMHVIFSGGMLSTAALTGATQTPGTFTAPPQDPAPDKTPAYTPPPNSAAAAGAPHPSDPAHTHPAPAPAGGGPGPSGPAGFTPAGLFDPDTPLTPDDNAAVHATRTD